MAARRSIVYYAWVVLVVAFACIFGVVGFVFVGSMTQRSEIRSLSTKVQPMQVANLDMQSHFLNAQRGLRGYQLTGQDRFLQSYYTEQDQFVISLRAARDLAWSGVLGPLTRQANTAANAFRLSDQAVALPKGSPKAAALTNEIALASDSFVAQSQSLAGDLAHQSAVLSASSVRTLGIGFGWTIAVIATALMIPIVITVVFMRMSLVPLHDLTHTIHRLAAQDESARAVPGGPADVRELGESINAMAAESQRLRAEERERARLHRLAREASVRIRAHLDERAIIRETITSIERGLRCDLAFIGLVHGGKLTFPEGNPRGERLAKIAFANMGHGSTDWLGPLYKEHKSFWIQDMQGGPETHLIPKPIREAMIEAGGPRLLITPFGTGTKVLGSITLLRKARRPPWSPAEIATVESLASDVGRGLTHAQMFDAEKQLVDKFRFLDRAKSDFLATVSHELRTPLTSITGYIEMLKDSGDGELTPPQMQMLDTIDHNAMRLRTLIEDVLTISKIESGTFKTVLEPVNLAGIVADAADAIHPSVAENGLTIETDYPRHDLIVDGDPNQLDRVLMNLLSNAVKYTPEGGHVTLKASREGDAAVITVSDTGIGIPDRDKAAMFTRFFRGSNAVERSIQGTGLGLSIVRAVVSNHHGEVDLSSKENEGTTVTVRIPIRGAPRGAARAHRARQTPGAAPEAQAARSAAPGGSGA